MERLKENISSQRPEPMGNGELLPNFDKKLEIILSTVNLNPRSLVMILIPSHDRGATLTDLTKSFRDLLRSTEFAGVDQSQVVEYCVYLSRMGLIKQFEVYSHQPKDNIRFVWTEFGLRYAKPAAILASSFEYQEHISLYRILGSSKKHSEIEHGAPYHRARILSCLSTSEQSLRDVDVASRLGIDIQVVKNSLIELAKSGAVIHKAVDNLSGELQVSFLPGNLIDPQEVEPYDRMNNLTRIVAGVCKDIFSDGSLICANAVYDRLEESVRLGWKKENLRTVIRKILSHLVSLGYLKRGEFIGGKVQSLNVLTPLGRLVVDCFINPIENLANDDEQARAMLHEKGIELNRIIAFVAYETFTNYYQFSDGFKKKNSDRANALLFITLVRSDHPMSAAELSNISGLHPFTVKQKMEEFVRLGQVRKNYVRGKNYYLAVNTERLVFGKGRAFTA